MCIVFLWNKIFKFKKQIKEAGLKPTCTLFKANFKLSRCNFPQIFSRVCCPGKTPYLVSFLCRIIDRSENTPEPRSKEHPFTLFAKENNLSFICTLLAELSFVTLTIHLCNGLNDKNLVKPRQTCFINV